MNANLKYLLWAVWIILMLVGIPGIFERFVNGHHSANYGSYVVWGLWVSSYIYFAGLSAGAFLFSCAIRLAKIKKLEPLGTISLFVALVALIMGLFAIWVDLGAMMRAHFVLISPSFSSVMAWMIWLYTTYSIVLMISLWLAMRADLARQGSLPGFRGWLGRTASLSRRELTAAQEEDAYRWLRMLSFFGIPLAISFCGGVGALFGSVAARSFWHTPLIPILFLFGALVSGGGLLMFVYAVVAKNKDEKYAGTLQLLGRIVVALLLFDLMLEFAEFSIPMWYGIGAEYALMTEILFGHFWWVFWIVHIVVGSAIPIFLILIHGGKPWANAVAGFLIATMFLAVRLNIVIPGLIEPSLKLLESSFTDRRLKFEYLPSFFEWQVLIFIVALGIALFFLGYRNLPLAGKGRTS